MLLRLLKVALIIKVKILTSEETGVSLVIPHGALAEGVEQEIYFKVCRDISMLPPLDQEKGTLN